MLASLIIILLSIEYKNSNDYQQLRNKYQIKISNNCGPSLTYSLVGEKLIIKGTGNMKDYDSDDIRAPWHINYSQIQIVELSEEMTSIGSWAFWECINLVNITIPENITVIGRYAFENCESLKTITIPSKVTKIENGLFYSCSKLTSINFSGNVKSIGQNAFANCISLTSIIIPENVTSIGVATFSNCTNLSLVSSIDASEI